jgi:hypothetical protein
MSNFNCSKIFVAAFNLEGTKANAYFESIMTSLSSNLPSNWSQAKLQESISLVSQEKLTDEVLNNK